MPRPRAYVPPRRGAGVPAVRCLSSLWGASSACHASLLTATASKGVAEEAASDPSEDRRADPFSFCDSVNSLFLFRSASSCSRLFFSSRPIGSLSVVVRCAAVLLSKFYAQVPCPCAEWPRRCQKRRGSSHHFHLGHLTGPAAGAGGAEGAEGRGVLCRQAGVSAQGAGCEASKCESLVRVDQGSNSRPVTPHPATFCWTGARNHPRKRAAQPTGLKRMPPWKIWFCS